MSAIAIFTVRDLNRQPAKILAAVRKFGRVEIRTRGGEVFTVAPKVELGKKGGLKEFPDFVARWKRMKQLGHVPPPVSENDRINRIISGEE